MSGVMKPFADHGHYTSVHDAVFDVVMPYCPPNAFKVLMLVLRKTRGWKKEEDVLSYSQIKVGTGIKSDTTLAKELDWLTSKNLLIVREGDGSERIKGKRKAPSYSINRDFELSVTTSETGVAPKRTTPENGVPTTPENGETITIRQKPNAFSSSNELSKSAEGGFSPSPASELSEKNGNQQDSEAAATSEAQKPVEIQKPGAYGCRELVERVQAARDRGAAVHDPPDIGNYGRFFANRFKRHDVDTLLLTLDFLVAKASGEVEGEKKAWCGFDTALDRVLEGWRPVAHRPESEAEEARLREEARKADEDAFEEMVRAMSDEERRALGIPA